jgi:hypothetical protein
MAGLLAEERSDQGLGSVPQLACLADRTPGVHDVDQLISVNVDLADGLEADDALQSCAVEEIEVSGEP